MLVLFLCSAFTAKGQEVFTEKFSGCNNERFAMENDTTIARINDNELIRIITGGIDEKVRKRLHGTLKMQILVDNDGNSCLLSANNNTNYRSEKLNLKHTVDSDLHWNKLQYKVAAIVQMDFDKSDELITIKRLGFNAYLGWHIITDKTSVISMSPGQFKNKNTKNDPIIIKNKSTNSTWKLYNFTNSMLPHNITRSVDIDSKGVVWCCTDQGVVSIDGENWTIFDEQNTPFPVNKYGITRPTKLIVDKQDRVWVELYKNIFRFDGKNWMTLDKIYPTINNDSIYSTLKLLQDISIDKKNSIIWFGTFKGLVKFENEKFTRYTTLNTQLPSNSVREVYLDKKNVQWITTDSGIVKVDNNKWTVYTMKNSKLPCNKVGTVNGDSLGNIWIGTIDGLVKIDPAGTWTVYDMKNSLLPDMAIWKIVVENNVVWLGMHDGGLVRIEGNKWEVFNKNNSTIQKDAAIFDLVIDKNGNKWIGTLKGLVFTNR